MLRLTKYLGYVYVLSFLSVILGRFDFFYGSLFFDYGPFGLMSVNLLFIVVCLVLAFQDSERENSSSSTFVGVSHVIGLCYLVLLLFVTSVSLISGFVDYNQLSDFMIIYFLFGIGFILPTSVLVFLFSLLSYKKDRSSIMTRFILKISLVNSLFFIVFMCLWWGEFKFSDGLTILKNVILSGQFPIL